MAVSLFSAIKIWKKLLYSCVLFYHKALGHTRIGPSSGTLSTTDDHTGRKYTIPIPINNNAVKPSTSSRLLLLVVVPKWRITTTIFSYP